MKIAVTGKTGQVATELAALEGVTCLGRDTLDLTDPDHCAAVISEWPADAIINAAAYTAVDAAETDQQTALLVNATAIGAMAKAAARRAIPFVHISTDYVFDGGGDQPRAPSEATSPLGVYGATKLKGELAVQKAGGVNAIVRTSWIFSAHGKNFVKTMLALSETCSSLTIVADQVGGPTPARDIACACHAIAQQLAADPSKSGTYHIAGRPNVSWAAFDAEIFAQAGRDVTITPIATALYPTPAKRPVNSRLDCSLTEQILGISQPDWRVGLEAVLAELNKMERIDDDKT